MTTLVTGGTGFVGSAVVRSVLAQGGTARVLCRPSADTSNLRGLDVEIAYGDLRDPASLREAVVGCRAVFHVAADYRLWVREPDELYQNNVTGTLDLLAAAAESGVQRIVYTSSVATLGLPGNGRSGDENTPSSLADMVGHYKRSKFIAEDQVRRHVQREGWPVVIVNPSTPVGPRDVKPTPTGRMVLDAARGRMPAFVDTGLNVVHVDDVAAGHLLALERGVEGERYILGGENMSLKDILVEVARLTGRAPPRVCLPHLAVLPLAAVSELWCRLRGHGEPLATMDGVRMAMKHMYFSSDKARRELGYAPRPAQEALRDAVAWFRAHARLD
jgi:dihydroflavonol-4-reductase